MLSNMLLKVVTHSFFCIIFSIFFGWLLSTNVFSYNESIVQEYNEQLHSTNAFFFTDIDGQRSSLVKNANYPSYYLYVDEADFGYIMNKGDNQRDLPVKGFYVDSHQSRTNNGSSSLLSSSFFGSSLPRLTPFKGSIKLRGVNALTCGKKGFRIQADTLDVKLKSMCGSVYSVEDYVYSQLLENKKEYTQKLLMNYPHELRKVYVNGKFYGMFLTVPKLNNEFLEHNDIANPTPNKNCIFKVYKDFDQESPLMGSMMLRNDYEAKQQLLGAVELNYGDASMCLDKLDQLVKVVNQSDPNSDDLKEILVMPSVLFWGLMNISSRNYVGFSHNYLLVYDQGKFHVGNWDAQEFGGCQKTDALAYQRYTNDDYNPAHRNKIFDVVLDWYLQYEKDAVSTMQQNVVDVLCDASVYTMIKQYDLKYVVFDRFIWNLGHMRQIDYFRNEYVALLKDVYKERIEFVDFFKTFYHGFDEYFGLDKTF